MNSTTEDNRTLDYSIRKHSGNGYGNKDVYENEYL